MSSKYIYNFISPPPVNVKSHVRGWSMLWAQRLFASVADKTVDISGAYKVFIDHGVNFAGTLNTFGGLHDGVAETVEKLLTTYEAGAKVYSLDHNFNKIRYCEQMQKRVGLASTSKYFNDKSVFQRFDRMTNSIRNITMADIKADACIVGDSHTGAYSLPNQAIFRENGKTLYSVLYKETLEAYLERTGALDYKDITVCLGSIDIRFHLSQSGSVGIDALLDEYYKQCMEVQDKYNVDINICAPVPVEFEGRKLPGSGKIKYDGDMVSFVGSLDERQRHTDQFIDFADSHFLDFGSVIPPSRWYDMCPKEYAKEIMELSSSVHISPKYYNSTYSWGTKK